MTKIPVLALVSVLLIACGTPAGEPAGEPAAGTATTSAAKTTDTAAGDKTVAEEAFGAGMRGKQKAEQIKADQQKRAAETDSAGLE